MIVKAMLLDSKAMLPSKATLGSAGYDLCSVESSEILPGSRQLVRTGIALQMPEFIYARIAPRSGLSFHYCLDISAGVIDSAYTGEIKVLLINNGRDLFKVKVGDKIAQIIFECTNAPSIIQVDMLNETERSGGGFGSTGYRVVR